MPSLNRNIFHGNSLIGKEIYEQRGLFSEGDFKHIYPFEYWDNLPKQKIRGGFDAIVGNPPYVKEYTSRETFENVKLGKLNKYYQGKMDLWYFFVCYGLDLLKKDGKLGYIVPNNWVSNAGASILRNKIISASKIDELIDFEDYMVFQNASIQTMIVLLSKNETSDNYSFFSQTFLGKKLNATDVAIDLTMGNSSFSLITHPKIIRKKLQDKFLKFDEDDVAEILDKILFRKNFSLDSKTEVAQGIVAPQDSLNKKGAEILKGRIPKGSGVFVITESEKNAMSLKKEELGMNKPFYTTVELQKFYSSRKNKYWIIYTNSSFKDVNSLKPYPNIKKHLDKFRDVITSCNFPYGLHRSRDEKFFKGTKIISVRKCAEPMFTYTDFNCYVSQTFNIIKTNRIDLKYLVGLLNSSLIKFWLLKKGKMQGSQFQVDKEPLLEIPIYKPTEIKQLEKVIKEVDKIIELRSTLEKSKTESDISFYKNQVISVETSIDDLIYELYNINENEQITIASVLKKI